MSSQTQFQRHSSASSMRTSSVPRTEMGRYISPTYRSSVFSHLTEEKDASFSTRNSYVAQSFSQQAEDLRPALRRANSTYRVSHVMPTVSEWAPNRNHINDPDFHDKIDEEAVVHARKRLEQEKNELKEKKMRHNSEYKEVAKLLEEKHQRRLDHKKPSENDFQKHQESQSEFDSQVSQKWAQMTAERTDFAKMLDQQIEEKVRRRQEEILKEKNDMRNSLDLKPRKEYDMEEYKRILQRQIEEKNQRKMLIEKGKQEEKSERIQDLKNEEATFAHYRQKLAYRKTQSVEFSAGQVRDIAQSEKPVEIVEDFDVKEERGNRRTSMEPYSSKRLSVNTSAYKNQQEEKRKSAQMSNTPLSATRYGSPTKNERAEKKNDWEIASEALLQRKEQQEAYLRDLKEQIMARKKNKDSEVQKDKQEEKKVTGLNMSPYKPKETVLQVVEIVKKQMAHKEDLKNTQVKNKKEETVKTREAHKSNELAMRKQYEEFCQQKMQMLARYKKDLVEESQNKKHKGLKTVKI